MNKIKQKTKRRLVIFQAVMTSLLWGGVGGGLLMSCKDSFDIDSLQEQPKLVVSCFPSMGDTTFVSVTRSVPVSKEGRVYGQDLSVGDATIIYKVNGQPREVMADGGRRYVLGPHRAGDVVEVEAVAEGYAAVSSRTVVPQAVPVELRGISETRIYDTYWEESVDVLQLAATFTDPADRQDYYAVRIRLRHFALTAVGDLRPDCPQHDYYDDDYNRHVEWPVNSEDEYRYISETGWADVYDFHLRRDTAYTYPAIRTAGEPLLQPLSGVDGDFGFENEFYQQFYVFSDAQIDGQTYTLRLNINQWASELNTHMARPAEFQVLLYHLTPEFYRFVKSINDIDNNELAQSGFSLLSPTFTNITGGIGILGAYAVAESTPMTLNTKQR